MLPAAPTPKDAETDDGLGNFCLVIALVHRLEWLNLKPAGINVPPLIGPKVELSQRVGLRLETRAKLIKNQQVDCPFVQE